MNIKTRWQEEVERKKNLENFCHLDKIIKSLKMNI